MLSPRFLAVCALFAVVSAIPTTDRPAVPRPVTTITEADVEDGAAAPWFHFPMFSNFFAPLWKMFPSFESIGPTVITDEDKFKAIVNVKDYKKEDLKVKVKGSFIFVQGSHESKQPEHDLFASQFFHTYTLPANSSGADVTAELTSDGFLVVAAPLTGADDSKSKVEREVPIVETGVPFKQENEVTTTTKPTTPATDNDDRKEPTTPPSAGTDENTEKDNIIPHGSDVFS